MKIEDIFKNNEAWINRKLAKDKSYFTKLSRDQQPEILYIGCSDSRVNAEKIMGVDYGEMFIHRNIGNLVSNLDLNVMAVINYAVRNLQVNHVIICGHYYCGGVKAAMQSTDMGILNPWLRNIRDVYRLHKAELNAIEDLDLRYNRLTELNVQEQCVNVLKTAVVQQAIKDRGLTVHGWMFDMTTGKIIDLKIDFKKILDSIMEIYRLD